MSAPVRLDSISPNLSESFRRANSLQRRQAALATSLLAISQTELCGEEIDAALAILRTGGSCDNTMRQKLEVLSEKFDEQYFRLNEGSDPAANREALLFFRKARAAAALAFAVCSESETLHEAIYEAIIASDDLADALRSAEIALRAN